jgi:hypothetical protein
VENNMTASASKSARLCELINRKDKVLVVLRPPTAAHGRIMKRMKSKCRDISGSTSTSHSGSRGIPLLRIT